MARIDMRRRAVLAAFALQAAAAVAPAAAQGSGGAPALRPPAVASAGAPTRYLRIFNGSRRYVLTEFTLVQDGLSVSLRGVIRPSKNRVLALPAFRRCVADYQVTFAALPPLTQPIDLCRRSLVRVVPR